LTLRPGLARRGVEGSMAVLFPVELSLDVA